MKEDRTEFGFRRTVSGTARDVDCCKHMPSYLVLSDLERLSNRLGCNPLELAKEHLAASPGSLIIENGIMFRVPSLVLARDSDTGHCKFLKNGLCSIHESAPYGCAFFDYGMPSEEADKRSLAGINSLVDEWNKDDHSGYVLLWKILKMLNKCAAGPEKCRAAFE